MKDRTECHAPNNEDDQQEEVRPHSEQCDKQCETKTSSSVTKDCTAALLCAFMIDYGNSDRC